MRVPRLLLILSFLAVLSSWSHTAPATEAGARMLDDVREQLRENFFDRDIVNTVFTDERFAALRALAEAAPDARADLDVVNQALGLLDASHCQAMPSDVYRRYFRSEFRGEAEPQLGLELELHAHGDGAPRAYVADVVPGSPAAAAGLRRGDEVLTVDGHPPHRSAHLFAQGDRRSGDEIRLLFQRVEPVSVQVRTREGGEPVQLHLEPAPLNRSDATEQSARVVVRGGRSIGYIRLHHFMHPRVAGAVEDALDGAFAEVDGLVLDLRGWGGRVDVLSRVLRMLPGGRDAKLDVPLVALIDGSSRSAKEVCAYHLGRRGAVLVGRRTAGAVLATGFYSVGEDAVVMLPSATSPANSRVVTSSKATASSRLSR